MKTNEQLAARTAIAEFRATQLQQALLLEKRKRQKGKRLNLLGQEAISSCQWFGVEEVLKARAYRAEKEQREDTEKAEKEQKSKRAKEQKSKRAKEQKSKRS
jgi:hypothetical protein